MNRNKSESRINFIYDGSSSRYNLGQFRKLLPYYGAMSGVMRNLLDAMIDAVQSSDDQSAAIGLVISGRFKLIIDFEDGKPKEPQAVNS